MECVIKHFSELSRDELFEIYKLRVAVFVVEQQSPYPEVDDADPVAYHIWFKDQEGILIRLPTISGLKIRKGFWHMHGFCLHIQCARRYLLGG